MEKTMKNWRVKLRSGGKGLAEVKIQRGIFQGDAPLPLLFVIAMITLNHILRKCTMDYPLAKSARKYEPLNVHGRHQSVCKKFLKIGNPTTNDKNIQSGYITANKCFLNNCLFSSVYIYIYILLAERSDTSPWVGYDTRSNFKRSTIGLNVKFSFSINGYLTVAKEHNLCCYYSLLRAGVSDLCEYKMLRPGFELGLNWNYHYHYCY